MDLKSELLNIFSGHEVLMANGHGKRLVGLEVLEPIGVGVCWSARFGVEVVCEYVGDLADGAMSVDIWISRRVDYPRIEGSPSGSRSSSETHRRDVSRWCSPKPCHGDVIVESLRDRGATDDGNNT